MRYLIIILTACVCFSCSKSMELQENTLEDYSIIPRPNNLKISKGAFVLNDQTKIMAVPGLENEVALFNELIANSTNYNLQSSFTPNPQKKENTIILKLEDSIQHNEGYVMDISPKGIVISGKTPQGVFYAVQTMRQLLSQKTEGSQAFYVPAAFIADEPQYTYRGMHLDVGRHFFKVDFIKKYIDLIALHKMNTFHWHLTEDQGWRIEIKKYPKLTEIGAYRKETLLEKNFNPYIGDSVPYGGFYTQDEIRDIVAYASKKHITIIPEIELPGHSLAAIASYPEYGNTEVELEVGTRWGVYDHIYSPSEETFEFLENVLTEVIDLFPGEYVHIGGDEAPKKEWNESKLAQTIIKDNNLKDSHELQSYFIQRIEKFLNSKNRNIIGWDEILEGGLAPNATVMSWRGTEGGIKAARLNHNVIMTPGSHCYFDHYQVPQKQHKDEPLAWGGYTSVEKVYAFNPTPEELSNDEKKYILGAQGNVWTEYMKTSDQVEYMVLPRMTALSEVLWTNKTFNDWEDFKSRLQHFIKIYDALELNYATHSIDSLK